MSKNPARAKRLNEEMPVRATRMTPGGQEARAVLMTVGQQKDRGKQQLEELKSQLRSGSPTASKDRIGPILEQIKNKYGNAEFRQAVKELNLTFRGFDRINLLRNKSPILDQP